MVVEKGEGRNTVGEHTDSLMWSYPPTQPALGVHTLCYPL